MPYKNFVFVKIQLSVLREYRFTDQLTDDGKLFFFLLISLAGLMENKIPHKIEWISRFFNLNMPEERVRQAISNVASAFPKLLVDKDFISWENFEEIHNYIYGKSQGYPKDIPKKTLGISQNKKENKKENKKKKERGHFVPPSPQEVDDYCKERQLTIDPQTFVDWYESKGWLVGKSKMKDWRAAVRTWERRDKKQQEKERDEKCRGPILY